MCLNLLLCVTFTCVTLPFGSITDAIFDKLTYLLIDRIIMATDDAVHARKKDNGVKVRTGNLYMKGKAQR